MTKTLFLEDLSPGQLFSSPEIEITRDAAGRFAVIEGRVSEMHLASITMRLLVESEFRPAGGILGAGIEGLHWPTPAREGELLHVQSEILEVRRSKSRPDRGLAMVRTTTLNAANEPVQVLIATVVVRARS